MSGRGPAALWYGTVFLGTSLLLAWPAFLGMVPLPAEFAVNLPLWEPLGAGVVQRQYPEWGDLITQFYPWKRLVAEALRGGEFPLWNPYSASGYPILGSQAAALLYPFTLLAAVLPVDLAWTVAQVVRPVLAALGAALFARALGVGHAGALAGGFVFGWCGFLVAWFGYTLADAAMWVPWVTMGVLRVCERPSAGRIGLLALMVGVVLLAGHPEVELYVILMGAIFGLRFLLRPEASARAPSRWTVLAGLTASLLLGFALSAVQLLPTLEWLPQLVRQTVGGNIDTYPAAWALGSIVRHTAGPYNVVGAFLPEGLHYAGLVPLVLSPAALHHPRRRDVWLFLVLLAVAFQVGLGWGPLHWVRLALPVQTDIPKIRMLLLANFALAMLTAFAVSALTSTELWRRRRAVQVTVAGGGAIAVLVAAFLLAVPDAGLLVDPTRDPQTPLRVVFQGRAFSLLLLGLGLAGLLGAAVWRRWPRAFGVGLCGVVAVDTVTFAYGAMPFSRTDLLLTPPPAIEFVRARSDPLSRAMFLTVVAPANWEAQFGLYSPSGYVYLTRPAVEIVAPIMEAGQVFAISPSPRQLVESGSSVLDFLAVRYVIATAYNDSAPRLASQPERYALVYDDGSVQVFENRRALQRAYLVPCAGVRVAIGGPERVALVNGPAFDPASTVVLEAPVACSDDASSASPPGRTGGSGVPVEVLAASFNEFAVATDVREPSLLVFSDTYYPGWRAFVDGAEVPILRANHAFKAVQVSPGQRTVRFAFDPWSVKVGAGISVLGLLVLAGLFALLLARNLRAKPVAPAPEPAVSGEGGSAEIYPRRVW